MAVGLLAFVLMPASPTDTASWFRGRNGWFTERYERAIFIGCGTGAVARLLILFVLREEIIMVNRVIREDPAKGGMHNRQAITPALLWQCLKDFDLWYVSVVKPPRNKMILRADSVFSRPLYLLGLTFQIPMTPVQQYLTLSLRGLGFDTFQTNLLAIPYTIFHSMWLYMF